MALRDRISASVADIRTRGQRLVQLNLELLRNELRAKGRKYGTAVGLFAAAGILFFYFVFLVLVLITVLLDLVLPLWASVLILTVGLLLLMLILVLAGRATLRKVRTAVPERAVAEAKASAETMRTGLRQAFAAPGARLRRETGGAGQAEPASAGWVPGPPPAAQPTPPPVTPGDPATVPPGSSEETP